MMKPLSIETQRLLWAAGMARTNGLSLAERTSSAPRFLIALVIFGLVVAGVAAL